MTLREKIAELHPGLISNAFDGGVMGCPGDYPELGDYRDLDTCMLPQPDEVPYSCADCWSREWTPREEGAI